MTIVIILGGILGGVFTATESAAVACVYAFIVTLFVYRDYRWRDLPRLIHRTVKTVAMVMMLIGFPAAFGYMMAILQIPARATELFLTLTTNKYAMLMLVNVLLLALGTFLDLAPMILICTPILLPVMVKLGVDPVHFGMILLLNGGIGLITPPVGPNALRRLRDRPRLHRAGLARAVAVLRRDGAGPARRDVCAGDLALAAEPVAVLTRRMGVGITPGF